MGVHNPGEHQHVDGSGLGAQQRPRAGVDRGAGGQNIVDQDHAAALNPVLPVGRDLERALYVAGTLRPGQADLLLGRPDAPKRFRCHFHAGLPLDGARQGPGLVVTAAPASLQLLVEPRGTSPSLQNKPLMGLSINPDDRRSLTGFAGKSNYGK